jgi:uncharacterized protein YfdQ (DUF2303 family)
MSELTKEAIQQIASMAAPTVLKSSQPGGQDCVLAVAPASDGKPVAVLLVLPTIAELADRPRRIKAHPKFVDAQSFIKYFTDFSDPDSSIFAVENNAQFIAVLDYHQGTLNTDQSAEWMGRKPRWCQHQATLQLQKSEEWILWNAHNKQLKSHEDFAQFIEDNLPDITNPAGAVMLEMVRTLTASAEISCESALRTNAGFKVHFNEVVKGTAGPAHDVEIPEKFTVSIRVYIGSPKVDLTARLRYRLASGKLTLWYDLYRAAAVERAAFASVRDIVAAATETVVLNGVPA